VNALNVQGGGAVFKRISESVGTRGQYGPCAVKRSGGWLGLNVEEIMDERGRERTEDVCVEWESDMASSESDALLVSPLNSEKMIEGQGEGSGDEVNSSGRSVDGVIEVIPALRFLRIMVTLL